MLRGRKNYVVIYYVVFLLIINTLVIVLTHLKILPRSGYSMIFNSYNSFKEAFNDWLYLIIVFSLFSVFWYFLIGRKIYKVDFICPSCENVQEIRKKQDVVLCNKCGVKMVPLKGFYEKNKTKEN